MKRIAGWMLALVFGFAGLFPVIYAVSTAEPRGPATPLSVPPTGAYRVFVVDWGYHTAIIVEQPSGWALGPPGEERAPFLEYAWGDRRFYLESDYSPDAVFATLALPTASVLYLDGRPDPPPLGGARAAFVRSVDAATLRTLLVELERSIRHTADGTRAPVYPPATGYAGRFYPALGPYLWTRNCNWWTVVRLAAAGLAERPGGVVFSGQVGRRLRGFSPRPRRRLADGSSSPSRVAGRRDVAWARRHRGLTQGLLLTFRPLLAKNPSVAGDSITVTGGLRGDSLWIPLREPDGTVNTMKLVRVERMGAR